MPINKLNQTTKIFFLILLFVGGLSQMFSQNNGMKVTGYVYDSESKLGIVGVNIIIIKDDDNGDQTFQTGAAAGVDGHYLTSRLPIGKYNFTFRNMGYREKTEIVEITKTSGTIELNVFLEQASVEIDEVIVRETKVTEEIISAIDLSPKMLSLLPSLSGEIDVFKSLQLLPGIKVASEMSSGIYVRGGSPDQNLTLVDGSMLYNPSHLGNIASTFNTYALNEVKLIKGAFPAEYGGRLSSVLDVKLREGTNEREKGIVGIGTIMSHATLEGPITNKLTYIVSTRIMYYDQLQEIFQKNSVTPRNNFFDINSKLNYSLSKDQNVAINFMYNKDNIYSPPVNLGFEYKTNWSNINISGSWLTMNNDSFILQSNLSFIKYKFTSSLNDLSSNGATDYFSSSDLQDIALKQNLELTITDEYKIKTGYEFIFHQYQLVNWIVYHPVLETSPDHFENHNSHELAFFIQNQWQPFGFLKTNLGVRLYKFLNLDDIKFEPRLSMSLAFTENILLKGAYAEAHQFLHLILRNDIRLPTDLWYPSTKKIDPSFSSQSVVGFDFYFNEKVYLFSIEAYYKDFENLYEFRDMPYYSINNPIEEHFTKGIGEAYGIEFFFNKRAGRFTGWVGYTISWTKRLFQELNTGIIFPPQYDRLHDVSIVLTYEILENLSMGLTWSYSTGSGMTMPVGKYYYTNTEIDGIEKQNVNYSSRNEYNLPDYHKMDINIKYSTTLFSLPTDFFINLYNAYNQPNAFAQYIAYDFDADKNEFDYTSAPKLNQITLMPFFPTFGFAVKF
jgi:CarboxypepD_reg-like domain/TonB-dependent Receptor Plug Domain